MCKAFSAVVLRNGDVKWKMGLDSHSEIMSYYGISDNEDDTEYIKHAKVEIAPKNNDYLRPDEWVFRLDESVKPSWWRKSYQIFTEDAHKLWLVELEKIIVRKKIVYPFEITPPQIGTKQSELLRQWASVWASVGASVWASVGDSVGASVWASVRDSVGDSVRASVRAYTGSFFTLPRSDWQYTQNIPGENYPLQPAVDLWEQGLVPSFDGDVWRIHGGKDAKILWEGKI